MNRERHGGTRPAFGRRHLLRTAALAVGAGAVAPTLLGGTARAADTIDVKDLGATGDGTTDDGNAIRQAVDQANQGGGTVHFPAGTYRYIATGALSLGAGVTLLGDGAGTTNILMEAGADTSFAQNDGDNVTLKDLAVTRNAEFTCVLFPVYSHDGYTFDGVTIDGRFDTFGAGYCHGFALGIDNGTMSNLNLINGTKITRTNYGLFQDSGSTGTTNGIKVTGCTFTQNYADDLEFNAPAGDMTDITVDTCTFSSNQQQEQGAGFGVGIANCHTGTVSNCSFTDYFHEAVHIEDRSAHWKVLGNTFARCGSIQYAVIHINSSSDDVLVQGNTIDSSDNTSDAFIGCVVAEQAGAEGNPSNITVNDNDINCGARVGVAFQVDTGAVTNNRFTTTDAGHDYQDLGSTNITVSGNTP